MSKTPERVPCAIVWLDCEGLVVAWSQGAEDLLGYRPGEVQGRAYERLFDASSMAGVPGRLLQAAATRGQVCQVADLRHRDGRLLAVEIALVKQPAIEDSPPGFILIQALEEPGLAADQLIMLSTMVDAVMDPIVVIDESGRIETFNAAAERVFGYSAQEAIGQNVSILMPAPDRERHGEYMLRYHETGERRVIGIGVQANARRKDGSIFPAEFGVSEMIVGGRRKYAGIIRDVTERVSHQAAIQKRNEELAEANARLAREQHFSDSLINSIPSVFYVYDTQGRFVRWNRHFETVTEYSADEVARSHPSQYFSEQDQAPVADAIQEVFQNGHATVEALFRSKSGVQRPYWFTGARIEVDGSLYLAGVGVDISERLQREQDLRLRDRAIEASSNGILIVSMQVRRGLVDYVNPAFEQMLGYAESEILARDWALFFAQQTGEASLQSLYAGLEAGAQVHQATQLRRQDGTLFWSELDAAPVTNEAGETTHLVVVVSDITETKRYEEALEQRANYDDLTGLANRNLLLDRLRQAMEQARRDQHGVALMVIDLDNFKYINDTLGHAIGDEVLKEAAQRLQLCIRSQDTIARVGGDEFVIVVAQAVSDECLASLMNRILQAIASPIEARGHRLQLTCSIGISLFPRDGEEAGTLFMHADTAMYRAKEHGRNNFWFFTQDMNQRLHERMQLEHSLREALEKEQLSLRYQPQRELRSGRLIGAEALLRWHHPELGWVAPDRFIPIAEETGLIIPISEWVLRRAAYQNRAWQQAGFAPIIMSVNLSARHFREKNLAQTIAGILEQTGLNPACLCLEITESHVMHNAEDAVTMLHELKALGVALSIDDFGTGYSSLSYLKRFPVDELKIDRSFVQDLHRDADDAVISQAVISLGHSLNMKVIAEGVDHVGQLHFLKAQGCDHAQGYYFGQPLAVTRFEALLERAEMD